MLVTYYVICVIYCFYQLNVKYKTRGVEYASPELDALMVLVMAWVLAPIDVSLTWIRMVKEAEQARINQSKFDIDFKIDSEDGIY
jgi:RNAse (barnase) inhibitor barstar